MSISCFHVQKLTAGVEALAPLAATRFRTPANLAFLVHSSRGVVGTSDQTGPKVE